MALSYSHFETASNSVLLACSRIVKKNQESQAPLQFPHDEALVAHLLSIEEPVCCEVAFACLNCFVSDNRNDGKLNPG